MKKEFIPYEQAVALKELGFDEKTFYYYVPNGDLQSMDYIEQQRWTFTPAPLYQQAFRWFREKYNIKPCFDWHPTEKYRYCIYYSINTYFQQCDYKTHEEAELYCLIKLIEIVKHKL